MNANARSRFWGVASAREKTALLPVLLSKCYRLFAPIDGFLPNYAQSGSL